MAAAQELHYPLDLSSSMAPTDALFWYAEQATPELRPVIVFRHG